jgi:hypothetical protein
MHKPPESNQRTVMGITGNIRFRKQFFTGLQIMQVEYVIINECFVGVRLKSRTYETAFRDATAEDIVRIDHRVGLITKPDNEIFGDYDKSKTGS